MTIGRPAGKSDVLTEAEIKLIIGGKNGPDRRIKEEARDYAVLLVFANTPMRKSELCSLKRSDIVDEGEFKYIKYLALKKKSDRAFWVKIPISPEVHDGLKKFMDMEPKLGPDEPLFFTLGKHGPYERRPITPLAIDLLIMRWVGRAGIKKRITPHSFRATYVTIRMEGRDPKVLQELGGWSSLNSMMPYVRAIEERKKEAALSRSFS